MAGRRRSADKAAARAAAATLREWAEANPRAPAYWRGLALRMADYHDAELWAAGIEPFALLSQVRTAWKQAHEEAGRKIDADEVAALDRVARAIAELREAVEQSPLQGATLRALHDEGKADEWIWLAWRDPPPRVEGFRSLSLLDLLGDAAERLAEHRQSLPMRAGQRRRGRPRLVAFVRWLKLGLADLQPTAGMLAHATNAAFALDADDALDAAAVRAMLRDEPEAFKEAARLKAAAPRR